VWQEELSVITPPLEAKILNNTASALQCRHFFASLAKRRKSLYYMLRHCCGVWKLDFLQLLEAFSKRRRSTAIPDACSRCQERIKTKITASFCRTCCGTSIHQDVEKVDVLPNH